MEEEINHVEIQLDGAEARRTRGYRTGLVTICPQHHNAHHPLGRGIPEILSVLALGCIKADLHEMMPIFDLLEWLGNSLYTISTGDLLQARLNPKHHFEISKHHVEIRKHSKKARRELFFPRELWQTRRHERDRL